MAVSAPHMAAVIDEQEDDGESPAGIPKGVARSTRGGKTVFVPHQASEASAASKRIRETQLRAWKTRRGIWQSDEGAQVRLNKMESVIRLTSSFLAELAAQDNVRLEIVQDSRRTEQAAERRLERHRRDTTKAIGTFL